MANYFDFMKDLKNPFAGMGKSITDPLAKGGLSILGSEVPEEYAAYENAGLLGPGVYDKSIAAAKTRGNRNAVIQGLLKFGTQNFNKGVGSIFNPAYLGDPLITAMNASQKQFDKLAPNAMNLEKLKTFKATKDKEVNRLAMVAKIKSNPNLTEAEREMVDFMSMPELIAASKPKIHKAPTKGEREYNENGVQMVQDQLWNSTDKAFQDRATPPRRKWQERVERQTKNPQFKDTFFEKGGKTFKQQNVVKGLKPNGEPILIPFGEVVERASDYSGGRTSRMTPLSIINNINNDSFGLGFIPDTKTTARLAQDLSPIIDEIMKREGVNETVARNKIGAILVDNKVVVDEWGDDAYSTQALIDGYKKYKDSKGANTSTETNSQSTGLTEGAESLSASGKPVIVFNGEWVYK